ncbi:MAG: ankyrin repeat-containing domain protein, partial [Olpidium bornovanus]
ASTERFVAPIERLVAPTEHLPLLNTHFGLLVQDDINITSQLIFAGAPLTQTDTRGSTAFHLAARRGLVELVYLYLMQGIDCDIEGEHRWTVLHEAVSRKRKKVAMILVDAGARLDAQTDNNETPAIVGAKVGLSPEEVKDFFG